MFPENLNEFRSYAHSFYGKGGLYDLGCGVPDIEQAILVYCARVIASNGEITWGDGDSLDRERVRYILEEMGFEEIGYKQTA